MIGVERFGVLVIGKKKLDRLITVNKEQVVVRIATLDDLPQIAHVARVTWDATYNQTISLENRRDFLERSYKAENLQDAINAAGHWFYVAEIDGQIVGFGHFLKRYHPVQVRAELVRLYVLPEYQNAQIGYTILKTGFSDLARAGIEQCFVSVQSSNNSARRFYERHGFKFRDSHGQFLGTQIITLVEYVRPIAEADIQP